MADDVDTRRIPHQWLAEFTAGVQANMQKLEACDGPHDFRPTPSARLTVGQDCVCTKCGGQVRAVWALWYAKGLAHGAGA